MPALCKTFERLAEQQAAHVRHDTANDGIIAVRFDRFFVVFGQ